MSYEPGDSYFAPYWMWVMFSITHPQPHTSFPGLQSGVPRKPPARHLAQWILQSEIWEGPESDKSQQGMEAALAYDYISCGACMLKCVGEMMTSGHCVREKDGRREGGIDMAASSRATNGVSWLQASPCRFQRRGHFWRGATGTPPASIKMYKRAGLREQLLGKRTEQFEECDPRALRSPLSLRTKNRAFHLSSSGQKLSERVSRCWVGCSPKYPELELLSTRCFTRDSREHPGQERSSIESSWSSCCS